MKGYLPPLKSLHFFMLAGKHKSFRIASQKLNVTQAAVSQQIRVLEEHLDVQLFNRGNRQTQLTEQGMTLLPFIEQGFAQFSHGIESISTKRENGILRISALYSFTSLWLMPRLPQFSEANPDIMVQLAPSNTLVDFAEEQVDLAIRMGIGNYHGLKEKKILSDVMVLVASPLLLTDIDRNNAQHVFSLPWLEDTSPDAQATFDKTCEHFNINSTAMTPIVKANNAVTLIENAVAGLGFTLTSKSLVADHLRSGRLVKLLNYDCPSPYSLYLVAPAPHFNWPIVKRFESWFVPEVDRSFADLNAW